MRICRILVSATICLFLLFVDVIAQQPTKARIPHAQQSPPNDPRSADEAAKLMVVPEGFHVEVVAAEPVLVNPVAMAIDERGRFWVTESLEYPRKEPGPGKDRVKVLEDTDGDGRADKVTVFLDGLNIPSGIAVGHGGVWVANAPDILFVQDTDGDGRADKSEVIVTGFGRKDTHELPNSLTWGPDGWLYGLNGVFNHSHVKYPESNPNFKPDHKGWPITCAMFRIHPRTREFQVFCEGTSNPWGIAFNLEGEAFISACVIDHLWHLIETAYYHRQGGPYPPFTWKMESIVTHKHQKAAYCGIHFFDSDAYPEPYRKRLFMGNIHGGCINVDRIERAGSTYKGFGEPDFLTANDAWFMPVVQKTGPDGSLYILDWYDRYHCYQDAGRDPAGIDRLKGRLYRVRYKDSPRVPPSFNLANESDERLIERLAAPNDFLRWSAIRLLQERSQPDVAKQLASRVTDASNSSLSRLNGLFALSGTSHEEVKRTTYLKLLDDREAVFRSWAWRLISSDAVKSDPKLVETLFPKSKLAANDIDSSPEVRLQMIVAASKLLRGTDAIDWILTILAKSDGDLILSQIAWQNLHPV
ncbi:MAG: dehydrogenase, partial [Planctomycetes bacterium]|nr:dehydrogenase [Planctomycetota bacterium]